MFLPPVLSNAEVYEIRLFHDEGWTTIDGNPAAIALAYGIARKTVHGIGGRHNRKGLPERWQTSRRKWR